MRTASLKRAGDYVRELSKIFLKSKICEPVESAQYIVAHAFNKKTISQCNRNQELSEAQKKAIEEMSRLRLLHQPIQYIVGDWDFSGLELSMKRPVFIPRPETEELVEMILEERSKEDESYFLEVGCGSGAISLALLSKLPKTRCVAIDINPTATELTRHNAEKNKLKDRIEVVNISFDDFVKKNGSIKFDFLVSNPPYIPTPDLADLQKEVTLHEDERALDGGVDGLDVIRKIIQHSSRLVKNEGSAWLETDISHHKLLEDELTKKSDLELINILNDFTDRPRFCHYKIIH